MTRSIDENIFQPAAYLVQEVGHYYARGTGVVSSGAGVIEPGAVLGQITANSEYVPLNPGAADGSEVAAAIAFAGGDATSAAISLTLTVRSAEIDPTYLVWADTVTEPQKTTALAELESLGIVAR